MKDVRENSVQWTDWDTNRECLEFDKVWANIQVQQN